MVNTMNVVFFLFTVDEQDRKQGYDPVKELKEKGLHDFQRRFVNLAQFVPRQSATLFEDVMCIVCLLFCTVICMRFRLKN